MSLPNWNMAGIIPPVRPTAKPTGRDRSPYQISLSELVDQFAISPERASILEGLLALRHALQSIGLIEGFQWIDGSFLERVEDTESRPPNDVDVVTFASLPCGQDQESFFPILEPYLNPVATKITFKVDHYFRTLPEFSIRDVCYWYSLWSHRRDGLWKGYVEIPLDPSQDTAAATVLASITEAGFKS